MFRGELAPSTNLDQEDVVLSSTASKPVIVCCFYLNPSRCLSVLFSSALALRKGNHAPTRPRSILTLGLKNRTSAVPPGFTIHQRRHGFRGNDISAVPCTVLARSQGLINEGSHTTTSALFPFCSNRLSIDYGTLCAFQQQQQRFHRYRPRAPSHR